MHQTVSQTEQIASKNPALAPSKESSVADGGTLLSEAKVLAFWPALSKSGLRVARQTGRIAWVRGKRGSAWYRPSAIEEFIQQELEQPCRVPGRNHYLNSADNGSLEKQESPSFTVIGMTPELATAAALASAQRISKSQKPVSRK